MTRPKSLSKSAAFIHLGTRAREKISFNKHGRKEGMERGEPKKRAGVEGQYEGAKGES